MYLFLSLNLTKNSRVETKYLIQLSTPTLYAIRTAFYWQICHIFDLVTLKSTPSETCPNTLCWTWWWWHRVSVRLLRLVKITFQMSFFFIISLWFCTRLPCCLPHALTAFYSEHKKNWALLFNGITTRRDDCFVQGSIFNSMKGEVNQIIFSRNSSL